MSAHPVRIASVSYLNSRPLVEGLDRDPSIALSFAVPALLAEELRSGRVDIALLPVIDLQRLDSTTILPVGGIGCDGPTLTVRLFSKRPLEQTTTVAADVESHTSVILSRIIFAKRFGIAPNYVDLQHTSISPAETCLLIGDKVITQEPSDMPFQLDLGQAWKELTGMPFVFAVWTSRPGVDVAAVGPKLEAARVRGMANIESIIRDHALPRGWPADIARQYLTSYLKYDIGPSQLVAIAHFHQLAAELGFIPSPARRIAVAG